MKNKPQLLRTILRDSIFGLSIADLAERTGIKADSVRVTLANMPDAYIVTWKTTKAGLGHVALWKVAHVPPNAPRPAPCVEKKRAYQNKLTEKRAYLRKLEAMALPEPEPAPEPDPIPAKPKTRWATPQPWH